MLSYLFTAVYTFNICLFSAQGTLPTAAIEPALTILAIGQEATFSCTTTEAISVTWMHSNAIVTVDSNHIINTSDQLFELRVIDFSSDLAGSYTCVAINEAGSVSSSTAVLELAGKSNNLIHLQNRDCRTTLWYG